MGRPRAPAGHGPDGGGGAEAAEGPPPASPVQPQGRLAPHVLPSPLQKHLLIESTELDRFFHSDVQDGPGGVLPPVLTVQEAHLENSEVEGFV